MKSLRPLLPYFAKYKWLLFAGLLCIVCSNILTVEIPPMVRKSLDSVDEIKAGKMPEVLSFLPQWFHTKTSRIILGPVLFILGAAILKAIFLFFTRMTLIIVSRNIEYDLKNSIFKHYQGLGQAFFGQNYTGDLMTRITGDVSKVRSFAGPAVMYTFNLSIMITMIVSKMISINPQITLWVLLPLPVLVFVIYRVSNAMNKQSDLIQQKMSSMTSFAQETFAGIQVLKSFGAEKRFASEFGEKNDDYKKDSMKLVYINALFFPTVMAIVGLSSLISIYAGSKAVMAGTFTTGHIVEFIMYVGLLTWPVASLGYVTSLVQQGAASMERINEFLRIPRESLGGQKRIKKLSKGIEFQDVHFSYVDGEEVLNGISFKLGVGQKLGIIGTTGSGKSTIAKLLMQVYEPTSGKILIDGVPVQDYSKEDIRDLFGYVAQDIFLFSESIRDNILFGSKDSVTPQKLQEVIEIASLKSEIETFSDGLNTILGERGITLSGGQKQRTAIARALVKDPQVLLVDDGLSAVDTKTEVAIKQALDSKTKHGTMINISHRISSLQDADYIVYLHEGLIQEEGSHSSLLAAKGAYAELFEKQMMQDE